MSILTFEFFVHQASSILKKFTILFRNYMLRIGGVFVEG